MTLSSTRHRGIGFEAIRHPHKQLKPPDNAQPPGRTAQAIARLVVCFERASLGSRPIPVPDRRPAREPVGAWPAGECAANCGCRLRCRVAKSAHPRPTGLPQAAVRIRNDDIDERVQVRILELTASRGGWASARGPRGRRGFQLHVARPWGADHDRASHRAGEWVHARGGLASSWSRSRWEKCASTSRGWTAAARADEVEERDAHVCRVPPTRVSGRRADASGACTALVRKPYVDEEVFVNIEG